MRSNQTCITDVLIELILSSNLSIETLSQRSGVAASTIRSWINEGRSPSLYNAECVLNALGFRMKVEEEKGAYGRGNRSES